MTTAEFKKQVGHFSPKSPGAQLLTPEHLEKYPSARLMGYARVSTEEQSIDMQVTRLLEFGVKPADPKSDYLGDLYCDTISASSAKRPWFNLLLKQIWPGDFIIVYSLSRLHRDAGDQLAFFKWAKARDIKIISMTEGVDLDTTSGKAMASMIAVFAEVERNTLIERTKHGMAERMRQGVMMGRPRLVTDEVAAEIKRMKQAKIRVPNIAVELGLSISAVYGAINKPST